MTDLTPGVMTLPWPPPGLRTTPVPPAAHVSVAEIGAVAELYHRARALVDALLDARLAAPTDRHLPDDELRDLMYAITTFDRATADQLAPH